MPSLAELGTITCWFYVLLPSICTWMNGTTHPPSLFSSPFRSPDNGWNTHHKLGKPDNGAKPFLPLPIVPSSRYFSVNPRWCRPGSSTHSCSSWRHESFWLVNACDFTTGLPAIYAANGRVYSFRVAQMPPSPHPPYTTTMRGLSHACHVVVVVACARCLLQ